MPGGHVVLSSGHVVVVVVVFVGRGGLAGRSPSRLRGAVSLVVLSKLLRGPGMWERVHVPLPPPIGTLH